MKKKQKKYIIFTVLAIFLAFTHFTFAQGTTVTNPNSNNGTTVTAPATKSAESSVELANPLGNTKTIPELVKQLLEIALQVGVPLIALAIIYVGYLFIAAQGAPDKLTQAKQALVYVLIGAGILLGAYVIAEAVMGTINSIRGV